MGRKPARTPAVIFDIDGTLVDSNYLHVDAWDRALQTVGHPAEVWRIHRAIGMDSDKLLEELLGDHADALADETKAEHGRLYGHMSSRLRVLPGARELLDELAARGHTVVLATSAPQDELDTLLAVLDVGRTVDVVTSGEDVENAKPDPEIVDVALRKAGATAEHALMVGDSVWDVEAAERAGVRCIGVLTGGYGRDELLDAGAVAVYADLAELLRGLDASVIAQLSHQPDARSTDKTEEKR